MAAMSVERLAQVIAIAIILVCVFGKRKDLAPLAALSAGYLFSFRVTRGNGK